jgi:hypothetical protein
MTIILLQARTRRDRLQSPAKVSSVGSVRLGMAASMLVGVGYGVSVTSLTSVVGKPQEQVSG